VAAKTEPQEPDFSIEHSLLAASPADLFEVTPPQVIGIDEAGRGPWAGPVIAGAAWINPDCLDALPSGIDDSKRLSPAKRQALHEALTELTKQDRVLRFATAAISAKEIDAMGILPATFAAMEAAVMKLGFDAARLALIVDGNLAPPFADLSRRQSVSVLPVIKGDGRALSIAIAALAAKQARDAEMQRLDAEFPGYGWASNMGYGTRAHAEALAKQGPTPQHRLSFKPVAKTAEAVGYTR
jgi:ribonuclease HII